MQATIDSTIDINSTPATIKSSTPETINQDLTNKEILLLLGIFTPITLSFSYLSYTTIINYLKYKKLVNKNQIPLKELENEGEKIKNEGEKIKNEGENLRNEGEKIKNEGEKIRNEGEKIKNEGENIKNEGKKLDLQILEKQLVLKN